MPLPTEQLTSQPKSQRLLGSVNSLLSLVLETRLCLEQPRRPAKFLLSAQASWLSSDFSPRDGSLFSPFSSSVVEGTMLPKGENIREQLCCEGDSFFAPATLPVCQRITQGVTKAKARTPLLTKVASTVRAENWSQHKSKAIACKQRACLSAWPGCSPVLGPA